jgi:hypothetical protein
MNISLQANSDICKAKAIKNFSLMYSYIKFNVNWNSYQRKLHKNIFQNCIMVHSLVTCWP